MRAFIYFTLSILFFTACQKRLKSVDDYHPEIELVSVVALPSGAVEVTAKVTREGTAPIQTSGFGFSENPEFSVAENQMIAPVSNGVFSIVYPSEKFSEQTTYYFKGFVTSKYGFRATNVLSISNIEIVPVEAPCTHPENRYRFFASPPYFDIIPGNSVSTATLSYEYSSAIMPNGTMRIRFRNPPVTGIYTLKQDNDLNHFESHLYISSADPTGAKAGGIVYVNKISDNQFTVQACSIPWLLSISNETTFDMHWILNY